MRARVVMCLGAMIWDLAGCRAAPTAPLPCKQGPSLAKDRSSPILVNSASGLDQVELGNVVVVGPFSGTYKMLTELIGPGGVTHTGYATAASPLGPWTKYGGNSTPTSVLPPGAPGAWDDFQVAQASNGLYFDGTTWHYYYQGRRSSTGYEIGHATSTGDFTSWTKDTSNPVLRLGTASGWESVHVVHPSVVRVGTTYYMFYMGYNGTAYAIGYAAASSPNGPWTKYSGNPVFSPANVRGAAVWHDAASGCFHMVYSTTTALDHATSLDGTNWTNDAANPWLTAQPSGCPSGGAFGDNVSTFVDVDRSIYVYGHCYSLPVPPGFRGVSLTQIPRFLAP